jgi:hypothetical protein
MDVGKTKQLLTVEPSLSGAWCITCVAAEEAYGKLKDSQL